MPLGQERVPGTLCIQNVLATAHQTAGATLGRATDRSPIKMHHLERYTGLEWHDHAYNRSSALHTCLLEHAESQRRIMGSLCILHPKDAARNSTFDISARNSRAHQPTRPSKCASSSTVRARSGTPTPTTTETLHMRAFNTPKGIVGLLCTQKVLATAAYLLDNARNSRGRATDGSRIQMRYLVRYTARSGAPTRAHNRRNATRARALNTQRRITGTLCSTQNVCARNMRHLKILGRATNLSSIKVHHIERHTGR